MTSKVGKIGKVVICGMKGVGKTAILEQLIYGSITPDSELYSTIEDTYVASVDTGRGRDTLRIYDTAGLQGNVGLPRQYLQFADAFVLVYDPSDAASLDMLAGIKNDVDKNKEKKEVSIVVIANIRRLNRTPSGSPEKQSPEKKTQDPIELILNRANSWCARERIKHYTVNALERASLYEPFVSLAVRLHPPQTKSTFPQLSKLTQKASKADS